MNFADYMSFEQFKELYTVFNAQESMGDDWPEKANEITERNFEKPLKIFLLEKNEKEGLSKINFGEGHRTSFSHAWNQLVDKKKKNDWNYITGMFNNFIVRQTMHYDESAITDDVVTKKYEETTKYITDGNFRRFALSNDGCSCVDCAQKFHITMENWKPSFNIFAKLENGKADMSKFVKPESCLPEGVVELNVNFPTGELLLQDWFKIPEFNAIVEYKGLDEHSQERSINYAKGRIISTTEYAEKFNFISISVGNSSPTIYQNNDDIILGHVNGDLEDPDEGKYKDKGYVCTDYWGVTIIDKQTLIDIISTTEGDKAKNIVEDYLKTESVQTINVTPGEYNFKFHGNYHEFNKMLDDKELPKDIQKVLVLSKSEIKLENKQKKKM